MSKVDWDNVASLYFNYVDKDHSGTISKHELENFLKFAGTKGYKYNQAQFEQIFAQADSQKDGVLSKSELIVFLKQFK